MSTAYTCKRGHVYDIVGRKPNGACRACQRIYSQESRERARAGEPKRGGGRHAAPGKHVRSAAVAKLIPSWLPLVEDPTPCGPGSDWHTLDTDTQIARCQTCPVKAQCLETGLGSTAAGIVWGGVLIGTPDQERFRGECPKGHPQTPENIYVRPDNGVLECRACRNARDRARRKKVAA